MKSSRNFWPIGIVLAFVLFAGGTAALVIVATSHRMELVSPDYYEQEIRFQDHIDRLNHTTRNGQAKISYDAERKQVTISIPPNPQPESGGQIEIYRPSAAGLDRRLNLELDPSGNQALDAKNLRSGLWKVRVLWKVNGEEFFTEQSVLL